MAFSHHEREEKNRLKREKRFKTLLLYEHGNKTESTPIQNKNKNAKGKPLLRERYIKKQNGCRVTY